MSVELVNGFILLPLGLKKTIIDELDAKSELHFLLTSKQSYNDVRVWSSRRVHSILKKFFDGLGDPVRCPAKRFFGRAVLASDESANLQPAALIFKAVASGGLKLVKPVPICVSKLQFLNYFHPEVSFPASIYLGSVKKLRKNACTTLNEIKYSPAARFVKSLQVQASGEEVDQLALRRCLAIFPALTTLETDYSAKLSGLKLDKAEPYASLTKLSLHNLPDEQDFLQLLGFFPNLQTIKVMFINKLPLNATKPYHSLRKFQIVQTDVTEADVLHLHALFPNALLLKKIQQDHVTFSIKDGKCVENKRPPKIWVTLL